MDAMDAMDEAVENMTLREYIELHMGPQHIQPEVVIPITVMYVCIFVTGVIGNSVVCLVVARNSHFQTPTNYYLFSLAISDLLILVFGLPNDLKVYWQQYPWVFGETVCKLRALVAEMTSYASVLTIVAFSTERYIAICHPLFIHTISTLSRAIKIISCVWVIALVFAVPFAIFTKVNYLEHPVRDGMVVYESAFCALPLQSNVISLPLLQCATFLFFVLPMTLIIILYAKIGLKLRNSKFSKVSASKDFSKNSQMSSDSKHRPQSSRKSVNKMLVSVVIAFFVCWAPFHTQRLLSVYIHPQQWTRFLRTLNEVLYYSAGCLYYFSATINPILYSLLSAKYREAFRETLCYFSTSSRSTWASRHRQSSQFLSDRYQSLRKDPRITSRSVHRNYTPSHHPLVASPKNGKLSNGHALEDSDHSSILDGVQQPPVVTTGNHFIARIDALRADNETEV